MKVVQLPINLYWNSNGSLMNVSMSLAYNTNRLCVQRLYAWNINSFNRAIISDPNCMLKQFCERSEGSTYSAKKRQSSSHNKSINNILKIKIIRGPSNYHTKHILST